MIMSSDITLRFEGDNIMSIPDLPSIPEVSAQSRSEIKYHILGTVQQTLAVEL